MKGRLVRHLLTSYTVTTYCSTSSDGQTDRHTDKETDRHTETDDRERQIQSKYCNPHCVCAPRIITIKRVPW